MGVGAVTPAGRDRSPTMARRRRARFVAVAAVVSVAVLLAGCTLIAPQPPSSGTGQRTRRRDPRATATGTPTPAVTIPWQPSEHSVLETGLQRAVVGRSAARAGPRSSANATARQSSNGCRRAGCARSARCRGSRRRRRRPARARGAGAPATAFSWLYVYLTTDDDNRVIRMPLNGVSGRYSLGEPQNVITGIPKAANHDGGRHRVRTGRDAVHHHRRRLRRRERAEPLVARRQDPAGHARRRHPRRQPVPGLPRLVVRAPQRAGHRLGLARHDVGERVRRRTPGTSSTSSSPARTTAGRSSKGIAHDSRFTDPVYQWHTDQASPSGIAIVGDTIFMAASAASGCGPSGRPTGTRPVTVAPFFDGTFGRLRDVVAVGRRPLDAHQQHRRTRNAARRRRQADRGHPRACRREQADRG